MGLPRPQKPSITTTDGIYGMSRCDRCEERSPVLFDRHGKKVCGDCYPRGAELIRVVPPGE